MPNQLFLKNLFAVIVFSFLFLLNSISQAQCCMYKLQMHDSYGDGWNGGYLQIYLNNSLLGNYNALNYGTSDSFQVCNNDTVELVYTAGSYENENTYQLYDASWNYLFGAGPTPATGNVFDTLGDCASTFWPGNNPCTAIPIDTGQCLNANNTGYPSSGKNPGCANFQGADIWFSLLVPPSGNLSLVTDSGTINDTGLAVWKGSDCTNLQSIGCDDDNGNGYYSSLGLYELTPGQTIFIQVFGYGTAQGSFQLCVEDLGTVTLDSTELPLVMINTLGQTIIHDNKINCKMDIKYNGPGALTYITDSANVYHGNIGIEIRGASSSGFPQRPYGFETRTATGANNNVAIMDMPIENDWILLSNFNDRSLIRNTIAYKLFADMGNYSPRTTLCEVLIDSIYKGIYVLSEKIKQGNNRVNIAKLNYADTLGDALTGGYILQQNYWNANTSFQSNYSPIDHPGFDVHFVYEYPKPDSIHPLQKAYIASYIDSLEDALYSSNFADTLLGYRKYLDVKSFIDYFIVNELSRNNDGFKKSVFFHKDKHSDGGKLKAGPVWDFDWAWKTMATCALFDKNDGSGWAHHINDCPTDNYSCGYYIRLLQDTTFANKLRCVYNNYRTSILDTSYLFSYIDSMKNRVEFAQARHFQKWPLLGVSGPAPEVNAIATTYAAEIDTLKQWIKTRLNWLDANIPGNCIQVNTAVAMVNDLNTLRYFPNPSFGEIQFRGNLQSETPIKMYIFEMTGKCIGQIPIRNGVVDFTYKMKRKGVYYFTLTNDQGLLQYGKLISM